MPKNNVQIGDRICLKGIVLEVVSFTSTGCTLKEVGTQNVFMNIHHLLYNFFDWLKPEMKKLTKEQGEEIKKDFIEWWGESDTDEIDFAAYLESITE